jgi:superfamily II RNA helicase
MIMTAEVLENLLQSKDSMLDNLVCVVMDEVHYINDPDRGKVWESTILLAPKRCQFVMLSATMSGVERFGKWVETVRERKLVITTTESRIVPLYHGVVDLDGNFRTIYGPSQPFNTAVYLDYIKSLRRVIGSKGGFERIKQGTTLQPHQVQRDKKVKKQTVERINDTALLNRTLKYLDEHQKTPTVVFVMSKRGTQTYAQTCSQSFLNAEEISKMESRANGLLREYAKDLVEIADEYENLRDLMRKGIAYHHSGMIPILKEVVQILFSEGFLRVVFATETLAVGVDMPTRTVVFTQTRKPTSEQDGRVFYRDIQSHEYQQMAGRAGRRGKDKKGFVVMCPLKERDEIDSITYKNMIVSPPPRTRSRMKIDGLMILQRMQNLDSSQEFLRKSFLGTESAEKLEMIDNRLKNLEMKSNDNIESNSNSEITRYLELESKLRNTGFIKLTPKQMKKIRKEMQEIKSKIDPQTWEKSLNDSKSTHNTSKEYEELQDEKMAESKWINNSCESIVSELLKKGLLSMGDQTHNKPNLTRAGKLANYFPDGKPLIMGKVLDSLLDSSELKNLSLSSLVAWLSLFGEQATKMDNPNWQVPKVNDSALHYLLSKTIDVCVVDDPDAKLAWGMVRLTHDWMYNHSLLRLMSIDSFVGTGEKQINHSTQILNYLQDLPSKALESHELGSMVKAILRLLNMVEQSKKAFLDQQQYEVLENFQDHTAEMLSGLVTNDSLYLVD